MTEHQVVVVFDVTAETREQAAMAVAGVLSDDDIESWWFPEADLKQVDRNDNPAGRLVFDGEPAPLYCSGCGAFMEDPHRAGCRYGEGCPAADPVCETDDGGTHDACQAPPADAVQVAS